MANYTSPTWVNDQAPKLNAANMQAITDKVAESQILEGNSAPTTATTGVVGQLYRNTGTGIIYQCVKVSGSTYTWEPTVTRRAFLLEAEEIPDTTQTYTFSGGSVTQVLHASGGTTVRTDVFTYGADSITETRTLSTGESLTITTNLTTLTTTVVYAAA